ncbi:YciK family oxidoreductase [Aeromonas schubertii]|uniref:Short chain dehydrogenase/reductase family oxidoreductase n=1 Tax=Aeromonas schubertii TaxID=652 RepID=A0A0S2SNE2_9GAMM|nr:YciK family oxidoreductase [Aeromonas schubertii]ALP43054.1 short chain dehydrogenase/reductase family oxidoreductase [Aeromonas schubertii]MBZ6066103.1 YciK family oxidoreductase [Aeromonas schubertii]QCG47709.1 YciK family oxidoreductase [Aeromonas schubertii]
MMDYQADAQLLAGKVILVTGAGDGIGKEAAITYAAHGATVILLGRTAAKLEATFDAIEAAGYPLPAIVPLDLKQATAADYRGLAETFQRQFGRLDGVLFNAGLLGVLCPFDQIKEKEWDEVMQVNVKSEFLMTQAMLPLLRSTAKVQGEAVLLYTSSGVGRKGRAYWGTYAISKFAVEGMMEVLADELENTGVRVNSINPGGTRTRMRASAFPAEDPMTLKTAADLMPLYLYLMGADSRGENGKTFVAQPK